MVNLQKVLGGFFGRKEYRVLVEFDNEAKVYIATSKDIPGLVLEVESLDDLALELQDVVPTLLENDKPHKVSNKDFVWSIASTNTSEYAA